MNADQFSDAIGEIAPALVEEWAAPRDDASRRNASRGYAPRRVRWTRWAAVAAAVCMMAVCLWAAPLWGPGQPAVDGPDTDSTVSDGPADSAPLAAGVKRTVALAQYPTMAQYPKDSDDQAAWDAWYEGRWQQRQQYAGYADGMDTFYRRLMAQTLTGEAGENRVCSPLNVYMALSLLAESASGDTQRQLLSLLGVTDAAALRRKAGALWSANYRDDGAVVTRLANAVWLDNGLIPVTDTAQRLAQDYRASVFQGAMGTQEYTDAMRAWLNEQTGGLLRDQVSALQPTADTLAMLASTVEFRAKWYHEFNAAVNRELPFHAAGGDVQRTFMYQELRNVPVYAGEHFLAYAKEIDTDYTMWLILPDQGCDPNTVLADDVLSTLISTPDRWEQQRNVDLQLTLPKFDVSAQTDLKEALQALGVTDVFDRERSDLSGLVENAAGLYVGEVEHAVRVAIDEQGVTAAAYTVEMLAGSSLPPPLKTVKMTLDRPFLFAVTGIDNAVLFAGVVENP